MRKIVNEAILSRPRILIVVRAILLHNKKILLIQRSKNDSSDPSFWEIPGGKLDKGQHLNNAIERELIEEAGVYGRPLKSLVYFDSDLDGTTKYKGIPYIRMTGLYTTDSEKVRVSKEHENYKWVTFEEALTMNLTNYTKQSLLAWESELGKLI